MSALDPIKNKIQDSVEELKSFDWADIGDIESIGVWPGVVKVLLAVILFSACLGAGFWFHIKTLQASLATVEAEELTLRSDMELKSVLAANLEVYQQQMRDMEESFGDLLSQLPGETEVPGLLEDISFTGSGSGLEFATIQLQDEAAQEFYVELPINIVVSGGYHDFGTFVSGVASLSRIVTLHDFSIIGDGTGSELNMTITAKTYRYNANDE